METLLTRPETQVRGDPPPVSGGPLSFVVNANRFPTDDNDVRLAINKGLDRQ